MRSLIVSVLFLLSSALFMSAGTEKSSPLSSDPTFINSVDHIATLHSTFSQMTDAQFKSQSETIANSIDELKKNYRDLNNPATANASINYSVDNLFERNNSIIHGDTCLRDFVKAVFSCFGSCGSVGPRSAVQACVAEACANYQACKAGGGNR